MKKRREKKKSNGHPCIGWVHIVLWHPVYAPLRCDFIMPSCRCLQRRRPFPSVPVTSLSCRSGRGTRTPDTTTLLLLLHIHPPLFSGVVFQQEMGPPSVFESEALSREIMFCSTLFFYFFAFRNEATSSASHTVAGLKYMYIYNNSRLV